MNAEPQKFKVPPQTLLTLGGPDSFGNMFSPTCDFSLPKTPVPVTIGFDSTRVVGFCDLYLDGGRLIGNISICSPEITEEMVKIADYSVSGIIKTYDGMKISSFDTKTVAMGIKNSDVGFGRTF